MQSSAKEALDLSQETEATHKLYGLDKPATKDFGACRLSDRSPAGWSRGVRFVQLFSNSWDHHANIQAGLPPLCQRIDQPSRRRWFRTSKLADCSTRPWFTGEARSDA